MKMHLCSSLFAVAALLLGSQQAMSAETKPRVGQVETPPAHMSASDLLRKKYPEGVKCTFALTPEQLAKLEGDTIITKGMVFNCEADPPNGAKAEWLKA